MRVRLIAAFHGQSLVHRISALNATLYGKRLPSPRSLPCSWLPRMYKQPNKLLSLVETMELPMEMLGSQVGHAIIEI